MVKVPSLNLAYSMMKLCVEIAFVPHTQAVAWVRG